MAAFPSPSQLLRDLDSCNSDPVAVASCFVERVRRAGPLPHPTLLRAQRDKNSASVRGNLSPGDPFPGKVLGAVS